MNQTPKSHMKDSSNNHIKNECNQKIANHLI